MMNVCAAVSVIVELSVTGALQQYQQPADMCVECDGRVYAMEKMVAGASTYHKWCFRCAHCNHVLRYCCCCCYTADTCRDAHCSTIDSSTLHRSAN